MTEYIQCLTCLEVTQGFLTVFPIQQLPHDYPWELHPCFAAHPAAHNL